MLMHLHKYFNTVFQLDYRALAFLRIATSLLVIADLIRRASDLGAHYSDAGIISRSSLLSSEFFHFFPSVFLLNGEVWFQGLLFIITGIAATLLLFGYKTKLMTVIVWYFVLSLQTVNPFILQRGDTELIFMLFWGMFLPWEKKFSIDTAYETPPSTPGIATAATAAYIIQVAYVYFFAFLHKFKSAVWSVDFTAVHYAFSMDTYANDIARWFLQFPDLLSFLTLLVLLIQFFALPAILSPIKNTWTKIIMVSILIMMQLSFLSTLHLGLFPFISITALIVLYPTKVWGWLSKIIYPKETVTIYYDKDCGFCRRSVLLIRTFMLRADTEIRTAQSDPNIYADMQKHNSWVIVNPAGDRFFTFAAGVEIAQHSIWRFILVPLSHLPGINKFGEWFYRQVANNRSVLPTPKEPIQKKSDSLAGDVRWHMLKGMIIWVILVYVTTANVASITGKPISKTVDQILSSVRLDQDWGVFAPVPAPWDGWYVIQATTTSGQVLDLLQNSQPVSYQRPDNIAETYIRQRWRKYLSNIYFPANRFLHEDFLQWHCNEYNTNHQNDPIDSVDLIFFLELTTATSSLPVEQQNLHKTACS